jgi:hypothetical protein
MSYVIYHKETTLILRKHWYTKAYETEAAAKAGLTRAIKKAALKGEKLNRKDYEIADTATFFNSIEKTETRYNLMSKKPFTVGVNSPSSCDPSSETYWCS